MNIKEAREELPDISSFCNQVCICCTANDWYCPDNCLMLEKAYQVPFEKILKSYARNDGDIWKVVRYIKRYKENKNG